MENNYSRNTNKAMTDEIAKMKKELDQTRKERDDYQWAYRLTEGILKSDPKWHGVNERFSDQSPIEAAKLAKEAMGRKRPSNAVVAPMVIPDYYRDLVEWIGQGSYRRAQCRGKQEWTIKDEATGRQLNSLNIHELLKSEAWIKFRKGL